MSTDHDPAHHEFVRRVIETVPDAERLYTFKSTTAGAPYAFGVDEQTGRLVVIEFEPATDDLIVTRKQEKVGEWDAPHAWDGAAHD